MITDQILFCYKCGTLSPEYHVEGYSRVCECGEPAVLTLSEAINVLNQVDVPEDMLDEEYDESPLDFDVGCSGVYIPDDEEEEDAY